MCRNTYSFSFTGYLAQAMYRSARSKSLQGFWRAAEASGRPPCRGLCGAASAWGPAVQCSLQWPRGCHYGWGSVAPAAAAPDNSGRWLLWCTSPGHSLTASAAWFSISIWRHCCLIQYQHPLALVPINQSVNQSINQSINQPVNYIFVFRTHQGSQ